MNDQEILVAVLVPYLILSYVSLLILKDAIANFRINMAQKVGKIGVIPWFIFVCAPMWAVILILMELFR